MRIMEPSGPSPQPAPSPARWGLTAALLVAAGVLIVFRLHAFALPLETDEANYAYIGGRLLAGDQLYVDVWDHQPPGVFVLFAAVQAVLGDGPSVYRGVALAFSLASLLLVAGIARRCGGPGAAALAAGLFALASADPGTAGEGCNREVFMNTFVLAAWYAAVRRERAGAGGLLVAGGLLGLGSLLKPVLAIHWLALAGACTGRAGWRRDKAFVRALQAIGLLAAGPALLWGATWAYFAATGRGRELVDAVLLFNLSYTGEAAGLASRLVTFFHPERHPYIFTSALPLWLGGGVGAIALLTAAFAGRARYAVELVLLAAASYLAICMPVHFWPHYYYLLAPAVVLTLSVGLVTIARWIAQAWPSARAGVQGTAIGVALVALGSLAWTEYREYLAQPPFGITVRRYNSRDFWGRGQGENVRRVTEPGDSIFVYGNEAHIYYYAHRRCASRYTMITGLNPDYTGSAERRRIMLDDLRADPPRLILVLFDQPPFPEWLAFLEAHYGEAVGWDRHDGTGQVIMLVYTRRDNPVALIDWDWDRSTVGGWIP